MKRSLILGLGLVVLVAGSAWAGFGLPKVNTGNSTMNSVVNKGVDMGKNAAVAKIINDKLTKYNCQFANDSTTTDTTCNMDKMVNELTMWKSGLESTLVNSVTVNVKASAKDNIKSASTVASTRAQEIRNRLYKTMSWWDYTVTSNTQEGNGLSVWVTVK